MRKREFIRSILVGVDRFAYLEQNDLRQVRMKTNHICFEIISKKGTL